MHWCDNPPCINPEHITEGSTSDNMADAVIKGRLCGGNNPRIPRKLTEEQVRAIRADPRTMRAIAADYGITATPVCLIKQRKRWKHVP